MADTPIDREPRDDTPTLGRRSFLAAAAAATMTATALGRDYGPSAAPVRYPDPDIIALDKKFKKYAIFNSPIQRLYHGTLWAEGPAWSAAGHYLLWSDIPNNRQLRRLEEDGHVSVFRRGCGYSNGNTFDFQGRQLSCEHDNRRVVRYEYDGKVTPLAADYQGKPLNAPNDIAVHPDGGIWFTDPGYGILGNFEGHKDELQLKEAVYRIDPKTGKLDKVSDEMYKPNGICFSPDYKKLYVCETGMTHYEKAPREIRAFDVVDDRKVANGRQFASMEYKGKAGLADGMRCDVDGNIWAACGWVGEGYDGIHCFTPEGERIGMILLPEIPSNCCFGGPKRNRLYITGSQSLYAVYVETQGAGPG